MGEPDKPGIIQDQTLVTNNEAEKNQRLNGFQTGKTARDVSRDVIPANFIQAIEGSKRSTDTLTATYTTSINFLINAGKDVQQLSKQGQTQNASLIKSIQITQGKFEEVNLKTTNTLNLLVAKNSKEVKEQKPKTERSYKEFLLIDTFEGQLVSKIMGVFKDKDPKEADSNVDNDTDVETAAEAQFIPPLQPVKVMEYSDEALRQLCRLFKNCINIKSTSTGRSGCVDLCDKPNSVFNKILGVLGVGGLAVAIGEALVAAIPALATAAAAAAALLLLNNVKNQATKTAKDTSNKELGEQRQSADRPASITAATPEYNKREEYINSPVVEVPGVANVQEKPLFVETNTASGKPLTDFAGKLLTDFAPYLTVKDEPGSAINQNQPTNFNAAKAGTYNPYNAPVSVATPVKGGEPPWLVKFLAGLALLELLFKKLPTDKDGTGTGGGGKGGGGTKPIEKVTVFKDKGRYLNSKPPVTGPVTPPALTTTAVLTSLTRALENVTNQQKLLLGFGVIAAAAITIATRGQALRLLPLALPLVAQANTSSNFTPQAKSTDEFTNFSTPKSIPSFNNNVPISSDKATSLQYAADSVRGENFTSDSNMLLGDRFGDNAQALPVPAPISLILPVTSTESSINPNIIELNESVKGLTAAFTKQAPDTEVGGTTNISTNNSSVSNTSSSFGGDAERDAIYMDRNKTRNQNAYRGVLF